MVVREKILNYNINNKHNPDFKLEKSDSSLINPELSGIDKIGNNVYIVNDSEENYNIKTNITTNWNNKTVRLSGNNNSLLINNMKLLRFNYDVQNENDNTELYSIINNKNTIRYK